MARVLPRWMHEKHGAYYLVRNNKWTRLSGNLHDALVEYARLTAGPDQGALGELVTRALADMKLTVAATSLCPCSKEISDYGAHNQRSMVTICAEPVQAIAWEDLVRFAEESASSEIWPLLKRPDEKWITERAYENPKFVEDLVRDVALRLNAEPGIASYSVDVENFESIHNHSAFARIERA